MVKKIVGVLAFLCSLQYVNSAANYMTIEKNNGDKISFLLSEKPIITYLKGDLLVNGNAQTSYAISDIKNYHFTEEDETGVESLGADVISISNIDESTINVQNVPQQTIVSLMNINGIVLSSQQTLTDTSVLIHLPKSKGVYIINVGKQSFKVIRR